MPPYSKAGGDAEVAVPVDTEPVEARLQELLVAAGATEALLVVVPDRGEVGEVRPQDGVDLRFPGLRIVDVVEVSGVDDGVGALGKDELEDRDGAWLQALVAEGTPL